MRVARGKVEMGDVSSRLHVSGFSALPIACVPHVAKVTPERPPCGNNALSFARPV